MPCGAKEVGGVYRPRHPQQSPFYRLVERFFPQFEAVYEQRYQARYGFWRPIIGAVGRKFLECGDLKHGFARVRCPRCREEFFVPFSCRVRCFCPCCQEKRALEKAGWVAGHVCAEVPHCQFVFTIPKRLRIYFRFDRRLLGELCRAAARTVITVYRAASGRPDAVPGMVGAIQTLGQLIYFHPHIHALVTEGVFRPDGTFLPLPKLATEPFLKLWEQEVFALLLAEGEITEDVVAKMRSWKHSGFSVDQSVRVEKPLLGGNSVLIHLELPRRFQHASGTSKKQMPICASRCVAVLFVMHFAVGAVSAAEPRPSVLFDGGVHDSYVAKPLNDMGIDVDVARRGQFAEKLNSGKYNVAVVNVLNDEDRNTIDEFVAKGGGVLICNPAFYPPVNFQSMCEWMAKLGVKERWEILQDSNPSNSVRDSMGCTLLWSDKVSAPVNQGVKGVFTLTWDGTTGCEPPMSFDFGKDWNVVVRGMETMSTVPSPRNEDALRPWVPAAGISNSPSLMALREFNKGRLAVVAIRSHWIFTPPRNCPTTEAMLTAGVGGRSSDWLKVFANTFRWLAEPSLKAGMGGAGTPDAVLNSPATPWRIPATHDWSKSKVPADNLPQNAGLVGARTSLSSGTGTVEEYVKAAKAAGLKFIVFLEDSLKMDEAKWEELVKACKANSDDSFAAVPGLTYEDAQGDHLYVFSGKARLPNPSLLLPDKRFNTLTSIRTDAYFAYVNEAMEQQVISGFWHHKDNWLHFTDYKLYNSFPVYSFENGKPVDDALNEYLYWMGFGGCQAVLAFEIMTSPDQVAKRAKNGWKVVWHRSINSLPDKWFDGAWSFSGCGSEYITSGPQILAWDAPNMLIGANGLWWRPDLWEYRLFLRVASDVGLKSVTIHDGDRQVVRRWLPNGAKTFEQEIVLANCQQMAPTLEIEDTKGGKAVSMAFWNRNLNMEEFYCSDRCNILGDCRLRRKSDGVQCWTTMGFGPNLGITPNKGRISLSVSPSVSLTQNSPTLPVDGAPAGFPAQMVNFEPAVPGELADLFSYPATYMIGPEIGIGQVNYILGYDPAEEGAKTSPLGHSYIQPQHATGNGWCSWHKLIPTLKISGWTRTCACNWLTEGFRLGWHETQLELKDKVTLNPTNGMQIGSTRGIVYKDGKPVNGKELPPVSGTFGRGTFSLLEDQGGAVVVIGMTDNVEFNATGEEYQLRFNPHKAEMKSGETIHYAVAFAGAGGNTTTEQMLDFVKKFGVFTPGTAGYKAEIKSGKQIDNNVTWRLDGQGSGIEAHVPKAAMPGFLTTSVENLNDNWSVHLVDKARPWPNHRALPIRDGRSFAELDLNDADMDIFIGHPVTGDRKDVKILVSWKEPHQWYVEAHNPSDKTMKVALQSNKTWPFFKFDEKLELAAGSSKIWTVTEK